VTFGGDVVVRAGERVNDVATMGGDVEIAGEVAGEIVTMGGDVEIREGGVVHGGVFTMGGDVDVREGGVVHGELATMGGEVTVAEGAVTSGRVGGGSVQIAPGSYGDDDDDDAHSRDRGSAIGRWFDRALGSAAKHALLFLLGVLLLGLFPERIAALQRVIVGSPGRSGVSGLLGFVGAVVLTVILAVTIIGIPGAVIVALGAFAAFYIGLVSMATVVGAALPITRLKSRPILQLGAGILALYLASLVPVVGTIVTAIVATIGFGAVILTRFRKYGPGEPPVA
jgi:hypothetical protein